MRHFAVLAALVAACGGEALPRVCESGRTQACACVGGGQGAQVCALSGVSWGACVCGDGGAASDAPADVAGGDAGPGDAAVGDGAADASATDASLCPAGWGECSPGTCVNLATTAANCGACGYACPTQARCVSGSCVSPSGLTCPVGNADCDNNETTGCEAQLRVDHTNCGTCGNNCRAMSLFCRNGVCAP